MESKGIVTKHTALYLFTAYKFTMGNYRLMIKTISLFSYNWK